MQLSASLLLATLGAAGAFTPVSNNSKNAGTSALSSSEAVVVPPVEKNDDKVTMFHGWVVDSSKPCYGLPGVSEPLGFFDPLDLSKDKSLNEVKRLREAEIMHGRVAMMATVGFLIGENTPTIAYGMNNAPVIANNQLADMPAALLLPFFLAINFAEWWRSVIGWVEPDMDNKETLFQLREKYYPGDYYFDPLELGPSDPEKFAKMATKELNNGRLAMLAAAGMIAQEQVSGKGILEF